VYWCSVTCEPSIIGAEVQTPHFHIPPVSYLSRIQHHKMLQSGSASVCGSQDNDLSCHSRADFHFWLHYMNAIQYNHQR